MHESRKPSPISITTYIQQQHFNRFHQHPICFSASERVTFQTNSLKVKMFLRRISRPLMMMAKVKETTGIVGLDVVPNAREVLIGLYSKTLNDIKAVPENEGYRKAVESFTSHRLKVCQEEEDWETIEKRLGCGQVEELIEEAQDEIKLIGHMIEWNPWGVDDDYECEVIENDAPVPKHVPLHRPGPLPEEFYKTLEAVDTRTLEQVISKKVDPEITSGEQSPAK